MNTLAYVDLVIPEAPVPAVLPGVVTAATQRSGTLRFGILDNTKGNADLLLGMLRDGLQSALPDASFVMLRKLNPSLGAAAEILDRFARDTDMVITAMAD